MNIGLLLLLPALALGGRPKPAKDGEVPTNIPIGSAKYMNAHLVGEQLRPLDLLGRFVDPGKSPLDETTPRYTTCSKFFTWDWRDPVPWDQVFLATTSAAASVGVPSAGDEGTPVYVAYEAEQRLVAVINDPIGLSRCCAAGDQCADHFVGELIRGKGRVFFPMGDTDADRVWYRAGKVKEEIGYRLAGNPYGGDDCGVWRESPPQSSVGRFFLGVSNTLYNEENAREAALHAARNQARDYLRKKGLGDAVLQKVEEQRWCVESFPDEQMNTQWLAHVLIYLPEGS